MQEAATVLQHENLISTAERIAPQARWQDIHYYVLVDHDGTFAGIFSSIDMLSYLSRVTQDDIEMARNLQSRIVRERSFLVGSSFEFVAASHAARGVGGDFYAMKQVTDTRWVLAFCDVSGKGVAAAIVTSALWGMLNVYDFSRGLSSFVKDFNRHVMQTFQSEKFITGVFLEYDEVSRRLRFCDMGHSHMLMIRDGRVHKLANAQRNMPVGVMPDIEPSFNTIRPQRGDHLFLLTDGLTEQQDPDGNEYGIARVVKLLEHYADQGVETIADRLRIDFEKFRGERPMRDDVTFALAKFVEQELVL
jgi:sigma-B regulation protein RsbU (phosphoserine phosphatase)